MQTSPCCKLEPFTGGLSRLPGEVGPLTIHRSRLISCPKSVAWLVAMTPGNLTEDSATAAWRCCCSCRQKRRNAWWKRRHYDLLRRRSWTLADAPSRRISKTSLSPAIISEESWKRWWDRVRNALKTSPQFDYDSSKGTRLKVAAAQVDSVSLSDLAPPSKNTQASKKKSNPATRLADWMTWIQADQAVPIPAGASGPPDTLVQIIETMAAAVTPRAVGRLASAVEERVVFVRKPPKATPQYLDCLVASLNRLGELHEVHVIPVRRIVTLSARLVETVDRGECVGLVTWIADYVSQGDANVAMVVNALLQVSREVPDGLKDWSAGFTPRWTRLRE